MSTKFKVGDHVRWNSEAGHVSGKHTTVHPMTAPAHIVNGALTYLPRAGRKACALPQSAGKPTITSVLNHASSSRLADGLPE
jgi:hypothetical protein